MFAIPKAEQRIKYAYNGVNVFMLACLSTFICQAMLLVILNMLDN